MNRQNSAQLIELMKLSDIFVGLKQSDLAYLVDFCDYKNYPAGAAIVQDAPFIGRVCVIDEGDVIISRRDNGDADVVLARFLSGECFGELDLFSKSGTPVSVKAEIDSSVLMFPGDGSTIGKVCAAQPATGSLIIRNLLSIVARRIRSTNRLLSQRSPWVQELRKLVFVDKLTGLQNKTWLLEELEKEIVDRRSGLGILIVKPDNFKTINDTYGHDAGDKTLALLAESIRGLSEEKGIPARHGGDVFAVVFHNANARQIRAFAREIIRYIRSIDLEPVIGADDLNLTVSVGVAARKPGDATPVVEVVQTAFEHMLVAREEGGNQLSGFGDHHE